MNPVSQTATIFIPSDQDIAAMEGLPAGQEEDQAGRLFNMSQAIRENIPADGSIRLSDGGNLTFSKEWNSVLDAVSAGDSERAAREYQQLSEDDPIKSALLGSHSPVYIEEIMSACAQAGLGEALYFSPDVYINRGTFAALIRDLAFSLQSGGILLSFGLPTHHAYYDAARGFCLIDKTAILVKQSQSKGIKPFIVGTDVNRDDGLNQILCDDAEQMSFVDVDIYDSRVYPWHSVPMVEKYMLGRGFTLKKKSPAHIFSRAEQEYHLIDLAQFQEKHSGIHPALCYAITLLKKEIADAVSFSRQLQIVLPTGWDSHQEETAACSVWLNQSTLINAREQQMQRFSDTDFADFFTAVFSSAIQNSAVIPNVYFGLEGGYASSMYLRQIPLLIKILQVIIHDHL